MKREKSSLLDGLVQKTEHLIKKIKNTKWLRTLPVYEIERAEERYQIMAENGWLLKKQGSSWERYERGTPQKLRYRIEYSQVKAIDGIQEMTDEQVDFYADCGWELVSERRGVYVFCAPAEAEPIELYSEPKEQIRMLRSVHNYIGGIGLCVASSLVGRWVADIWTDGTDFFSLATLYAGDWLILFSIAALVYVVWDMCYGYYRCHLLVRRVKKGKTLHHTPEEKKSKHLVGKAIKSFLGISLLITIVGSIVLIVGRDKEKLPESGEGIPYLLAGEVYEGERTDKNIFGRGEKNEVTHTKGILAEYYHTTEYLIKDDDFVSLDQNLYILRSQKRAISLADSLLEQSLFGSDDGKVFEHPFFDYVVEGRYTMVAVKGNMVIGITCISSDALREGWMTVLEVLAKKWD
ncbi:MAG: DUF2812 domain-containing protein [Lachnospiraceae bacterium]|nr:DUF2812 domain-containing protein [Lachnospiraceae bacterium]